MAGNDPLHVTGRSVGGLETCIDLPELKLCFDIGRCPPWAVSRGRVLFTHPHMDHLGGVAYHAATRALTGQTPPIYVVAPEVAPGLARLLDAWRELDRSELPCDIVAVAPGDVVALDRGWRARPFRSVHRVACQGYALERRRTSLRPEFEGLPQDELRRLAREGVELSGERWTNEFAFTGDTRIEVVEREEAVRTARVLVLECTFLDERVDRARVHETGHTHLDEIVERAGLFENERIVLSHFSARYSAEQIVALLDAKCPPDLRERIVPLLHERPG